MKPLNTKRLSANIILPLILFTAIFLYINTLPNDLVYDDDYIIKENYLIKTFKNLPALFQKEYLHVSGELSYRPVVTFTYFIDYAIWRINPFGYHLTNIILHTINVFLFYCFIKLFFKRETTSILATLLFLSHPILTETVNAVCYREDILACLFFLLAFIYFVKMSFSPKTRPRFFLYYTFSCTAYGLALFSKEMAITLPILLILYHLLHPSGNPINSGNKPLTRPYSANIIRLLFFYSGYISVTGFYLYLRFIVFKNTYKIIEISQSNVFAMAKVVASYLKLLFIPVHLNADYCVPPAKYPSISFILSSLLIISALIIIVRLRHTYKQATFFNMWFFITLLPVLGIIPIGNIMAERYLYLPIVGFCASSGYMLANKTLRNKGIIIAGIIILGMQLYTVGRNIVWRDNATLWFYTYKREPDSARACSNLGNFYFGNKHYEKAIQMYKKALTFQYSYPFIHFNLGVAYEKTGLTDLAMNEYKASISRHSDNTLAYNNLGTIYHKQGLHDLAIKAYNQSLAINPHYPPTHFNLGNTYESAGNYEKALSEYNAAIKEDIFYADAHNNIGAIYLKEGLTNQAIEEYKKTIQLKPDHLDAHYNLGIAYAGKNSFPEAIQELQLALQYNPNDFAAYRELGILYFKHEKDINKSLHYLRESLKCVKDPAEATKLEEFIQAIHAELNSEKQR